MNFYDEGSLLCVQSNNCNKVEQQIALVTIITIQHYSLLPRIVATDEHTVIG